MPMRSVDVSFAMRVEGLAVERRWCGERCGWGRGGKEEVRDGGTEGITSVLRRIAGAFVFHLVAWKRETAMVIETTMRRSKKDDIANNE